MFTVRPLRLSRVAYRTVVVYSLLVLTTVWLLQDMLFGTKLDLTNPDDAKLLVDCVLQMLCCSCSANTPLLMFYRCAALNP